MTKIVLFGLEGSLAEALSRVLLRLGHEVQVLPPGRDWPLAADGDLLFLAGDTPFREVLDSVKRKQPDLPVIVTTRLPEISTWLDALEAGAADYCAAPFELAPLRWTVEGALPALRRVA